MTIADERLLFYVSNTIFHEDDGPEVGCRLHSYGSAFHQQTLDYLVTIGMVEPTINHVKGKGYRIYQPTKKALNLRKKLTCVECRQTGEHKLSCSTGAKEREGS